MRGSPAIGLDQHLGDVLRSRRCVSAEISNARLQTLQADSVAEIRTVITHCENKLYAKTSKCIALELWVELRRPSRCLAAWSGATNTECGTLEYHRFCAWGPVHTLTLKLSRHRLFDAQPDPDPDPCLDPDHWLHDKTAINSRRAARVAVQHRLPEGARLARAGLRAADGPPHGGPGDGLPVGLLHQAPPRQPGLLCVLRMFHTIYLLISDIPTIHQDIGLQCARSPAFPHPSSYPASSGVPKRTLDHEHIRRIAQPAVRTLLQLSATTPAQT